MLPISLMTTAASAEDKPRKALESALTFHAAFDGGTDAAFALGDKRLYTADDYKVQDQATPGLGNPDVEIARGQGRFGDALHFRKKNSKAIFYHATSNVAFDPKNWNGAVSFWLKLDPDQDLEPGYCDPIQVTDKAYNDSAIWVDFTKDDKPRHFRLGVFGDLKTWNPQDVPPDKNPDFVKRLVIVKKTPFSREKWTHVAVTHSGLGSGNGSARLYLNGQLQGSAQGIKEPFTWDMKKGAIRLGLSYVGRFDDLALFNRELTEAEVKALYRLKKGVAELHKGR
ncbi:MAG: LamG-like jellyroll fold domain-containing protein [Bryobacteraceae bacterium]